MGEGMPDPSALPVVPTPSHERLNHRQLDNYRQHRERLITWMLSIGKDPDHGEAYAPETVRRRCYNTDAFYRWVWEQDGYTTAVTTDHADEYIRNLAYEEMTNTAKSNTTKSLKMLFRWRAFTFDDTEPWDPPDTFSQRHNPTSPRDYLTKEERRLISEAALEYGTVPHYNALDPDQREQWKMHLAHRFGKPLRKIGADDFQQANSFKMPSLIWASLDAGLRPIEVARATTSWVDIENSLLRIPAEESSKNKDHWHVSLRDQTAEFLDHWLLERDLYEKYDGSEKVWLTRHANPYRSTALKYVLGKLCEIADIDTEDRQMTWYTIRHSVGTYMTREEGLAAAQAQLRHRNIGTTSKYDAAPVEDRRDALDRMG